MRLLIVRHAIAMERDEFQLLARRQNRSQRPASDDLRPLTEKGVRKMKKNAQGLRELVGRPQLLVSSPLKRAVQTAEILEVALATGAPGKRIQLTETLRPEADPADLALWLNDRAEVKLPQATIAVVGHEPHLTNFVGWLLSGQARSILELKKGGACLIEFRGLIARGQGRLLWHVTPPMLRSID